MEVKPGAISHCHAKVVFIQMLRRIGHGDRRFSINQLRAKFNDSLNNAAAKTNGYMLMVNSCNSFEHFDPAGNLSEKGKCEFFREIDDLLHHFDLNKVKLLPNPKNRGSSTQQHGRPVKRKFIENPYQHFDHPTVPTMPGNRNWNQQKNSRPRRNEQFDVHNQYNSINYSICTAV